MCAYCMMYTISQILDTCLKMPLQIFQFFSDILIECRWAENAGVSIKNCSIVDYRVDHQIHWKNQIDFS